MDQDEPLIQMLEEFADADEGVHSDGLVTTLSNFLFFAHDAAKKLECFQMGLILQA